MGTKKKAESKNVVSMQMKVEYFVYDLSFVRI